MCIAVSYGGRSAHTGTKAYHDCIIRLTQPGRIAPLTRVRQGILPRRAVTEISIKGRPSSADSTVFAVIVAVSLCHFINDVMQSLLAAIYPLLNDN